MFDMAVLLCEFTALQKSQNTYWMQFILPPAGSKCAEQNNRLMLQYPQRHWSPCYYLQDMINSSRHCYRPSFPPSKFFHCIGSPTSPTFTFLHFTSTLKSISRTQAVSCLPQQEAKGFIPDLSIQNLWWKHHIRMWISPSTAAFSWQYQCTNAPCSLINPILTQYNLSNWQHHKIKHFKQDVKHLFTVTANFTAFGTQNCSIVNNVSSHFLN